MYWNYLVPLIALFLVIRSRYSLPGTAISLSSRIKIAIGGMALAASLCLLVNGSLSLFHDIELYQKTIDGPLLSSLFTIISSVLIEELFFRGALFLILVAILPIWSAILLASLAFGIYHWFSFGVIGNVPAMLAVAITTGSFGAVMCYAYLRSHTLMVPVAIHAGWNLANALLIDTSGRQMALWSTQHPVPKEWSGFIVFIAAAALLMLFVGISASRSCKESIRS